MNKKTKIILLGSLLIALALGYFLSSVHILFMYPFALAWVVGVVLGLIGAYTTRRYLLWGYFVSFFLVIMGVTAYVSAEIRIENRKNACEELITVLDEYYKKRGIYPEVLSEVKEGAELQEQFNDVEYIRFGHSDFSLKYSLPGWKTESYYARDRSWHAGI